MKKQLSLIVLLAFSLSLFSQVSFTLKSNTTYTDNAFQLSEDDIDVHDSGDSKFDYIETRDDMIHNLGASLIYRNKIKSLKYSLTAKGGYNGYLKNSDKSKYTAGVGFGLDTKKLDIGFFAGYYPDNYVRKYQDKDGTQEYEKFEYDKNLFKLDGEFRLSRKSYLLAYVKYEDYYHNQYFTEYDAEALTTGLGFKYSLSELYLQAWYYYRVYETVDNITAEDAVSDASYESNIYKAQLRFKKIKCKKIGYRPVFDLSYEKRYFDGYDKYHSGREDDMFKFSPSVKFYLSSFFNLTLDYTLQYRTVTSDNQSVEDSKSYTENQYSLAFEIPLKINF
ncbi:MAG: hypothetical protein B6226_00390 [Candidatus Cloacimonetes bacterium 4572_65]|nr:MAG: hypothetical protein B6226_00390 [Candidatus Cloacimonetes bacterium 4572_65]